MTDLYPYDAWGVEGLDPSAHHWLLIESQVHGRRNYAERGRQDLIDQGWDADELRIVPLTIHRREENRQ